MDNIRDRQKNAVLVALGASFAGAMLLAWMTGPYGLVVTAETVGHFRSARLFATGEGVPSLYEALLAVGYFVGQGPAEWSRSVAIVLFGLNIALFSGLGYYLTGKVRGAVLAGALMLLAPSVVVAHAAALPGALILLLILVLIWVLAHYFKGASCLAPALDAVVRHRSGRVVLALLLAGVVFMAVKTAGFVIDLHRDGLGYNGRAWTGTALVKTVKTLADQVKVYTNDPEAFYFYAGRPAAGGLSARDGQACLAPGEAMPRDFMEQGAIAVIFDHATFTPDACWTRFVRTAPLKTLFRDGWGLILGYGKGRP